jgi:hypothetical protein
MAVVQTFEIIAVTLVPPYVAEERQLLRNSSVSQNMEQHDGIYVTSTFCFCLAATAKNQCGLVHEI